MRAALINATKGKSVKVTNMYLSLNGIRSRVYVEEAWISRSKNKGFIATGIRQSNANGTVTDGCVECELNTHWTNWKLRLNS